MCGRWHPHDPCYCIKAYAIENCRKRPTARYRLVIPFSLNDDQRWWSHFKFLTLQVRLPPILRLSQKICSLTFYFFLLFGISSSHLLVGFVKFSYYLSLFCVFLLHSIILIASSNAAVKNAKIPVTVRQITLFKELLQIGVGINSLFEALPHYRFTL